MLICSKCQAQMGDAGGNCPRCGAWVDPAPHRKRLQTALALIAVIGGFGSWYLGIFEYGWPIGLAGGLILFQQAKGFFDSSNT
jgi:hypothetical protein